MGAAGEAGKRIGSQPKRGEDLKRWRRRVEVNEGAGGRRRAGGKLAMKVRERERDFENEERSRGGGRALLFDSSRAAAENTNGRIMKMTSCDAAATLARRDSFEQ